MVGMVVKKERLVNIIVDFRHAAAAAAAAAAVKYFVASVQFASLSIDLC
jgi:hypothetical protein